MARHRGHAISAATRLKISRALKGRKHKGSHRASNPAKAQRLKRKEVRKDLRMQSASRKQIEAKNKRKVKVHNAKPGATRRSLSRTRQAPKGYHFGFGGKLVRNGK